jgi:hypothetical protein
MFPVKFTVYAVVSTPMSPGIGSLSDLKAKIESYHLHEHMAKSDAEKLRTWKGTAVVEQQMDANDLVRLLNRVIQEHSNG